MDHLKFHTDKLRASGLRPTKQRLAISKILFNRKETFALYEEEEAKLLLEEIVINLWVTLLNQLLL